MGMGRFVFGSFAALLLRALGGAPWADENHWRNRDFGLRQRKRLLHNPSPPVLGGRGEGVRGDRIPRENFKFLHTTCSPSPLPLSPEYRGEGNTRIESWIHILKAFSSLRARRCALDFSPRGWFFRQIAPTGVRLALGHDTQEQVFQRRGRMTDGFDRATVLGQDGFEVAAHLVVELHAAGAQF